MISFQQNKSVDSINVTSGPVELCHVAWKENLIVASSNCSIVVRKLIDESLVAAIEGHTAPITAMTVTDIKRS